MYGCIQDIRSYKSDTFSSNIPLPISIQQEARENVRTAGYIAFYKERRLKKYFKFWEAASKEWMPSL